LQEILRLALTCHSRGVGQKLQSYSGK